MKTANRQPLPKRLLALLLALSMLIGLMVVAGTAAEDPNVLESSALEAFAAGAKADGDTQTVGNFTILWSAKAKIDSSSKTWDDSYSSGQRINFGGGASTAKNAIRFDTTGAATVKIWWAAGDAGRQMTILDASGDSVATTSVESVKNAAYLSELELTDAGTYYLGGVGNNYIFKVEVTTGAAAKPPRIAWDELGDPEIYNVAVDTSIVVTVGAWVGYDGADKVTVTMTGPDGVPTSLSSGKYQEVHELTFTPTASGSYTFSVAASREEEADHTGNVMGPYTYVLPLTAPNIKYASNAGGGSLAVAWDSVAEADSYRVWVDNNTQTVTGTEATVTGLTVGQTVTLHVAALRGNEEGPDSSREVTVTQEGETIWAFSAFGTGIDLKTNGFEGNANDGQVRVYSNSGKGKLVPASTDGLAFYYTKVNPNTTNFKLTATATVNNWYFSNGQEGFGLMAADAVGLNGDNSTFWNNSYMANVTKVEYTENGTKYSMKLGIGSQEKIGVEASNINASKQLDDMSVYSSVMRTLETSMADAGQPAGTYNLVGNYTNASAPTGTIENPLISFVFTLEKNNTGYFLSYTNPAGETSTNKYYDTQALNHLDPDNVYVGFFASRYADITFTDISFTTSDPATDPPAEERPTTKVEPSYLVESATIANNSAYTLVYYGNADGTLSVKNSSEQELFSGAVTAKTKVRIPVTLVSGDNRFQVTMAPDQNYRPSEYEVLSSYEPVTISHNVSFRVNSAKEVYVSPTGSDDAAGTKADPQSITTAVARAIPGQKIYLMEGTYNLTNKLILERGINGESENLITLMADPDAQTRPVLDFGLNSAGLIVAGDYWHLYGFDVTRSKNGEKGIQVSGNRNILELLETYRNGNTGIQIARYKGTDQRDEWPQYNLILNCTSYLNADAGYEDADGFAAKLTIGEGNMFDGCIAHHNADDGWDLYAKIENGPIGKVIIMDSVAYKNGYILDDNGTEINAGNGNGFKMGGESIPGGHTLINSVAFANKAKGIDSNSCPDIQAYHSTSFDNESYNVAFYTNTAVNTDFAANGVLSYKKTNMVSENIKPVGNQDESKLYSYTNYYLSGSSFVNSEGDAVQDNWFVSLDTAAAINGGITRTHDGSVNMNGFLVLTKNAPEDVGATMVFLSAEFVDATHLQIFDLPDYMENPLVTVEGLAENLQPVNGMVTLASPVQEGVEYTIRITSNNIVDRVTFARFGTATPEPEPVDDGSIDDSSDDSTPASGGGSYSGGGSSSGSTATTPAEPVAAEPTVVSSTTTTNADGSVTVTETKSDGSTEATTTNPDGSTTTATTAADGSTGKVALDASGNLLSAEAAVSPQALAAALAESKPIQVPIALPELPAAPVEGQPAEPVTVSITLPDFNGDPNDVANLPEVEIELPNVGPGTVAFLKDSEGNLNLIKECRTGSIIVPMAASGELVILDNAKSFADVASDSWYADSVGFVTARQIFNGWGVTFMPTDTMNRAMIAQVLYNYDRKAAPADVVFSDVSSEDWFRDAASWAASTGIIPSVGDTFLPDAAITRQDFVAILYRYAKHVGYDVSAAADLSAYQDVWYMTSDTTDAPAWAVAKGIIQGYNGSLNPSGVATRAEIATMLKRFVENAR